jgi:hypothetical protein
MWQWLVGTYTNYYQRDDKFWTGLKMRTRRASLSMAEDSCKDGDVKLVGRVRIKAINERGMARFIEVQKAKQVR